MFLLSAFFSSFNFLLPCRLLFDFYFFYFHFFIIIIIILFCFGGVLHHAVDERIPHLVDDGGGLCVLELEDTLNHRQLRAGGVHAGKGAPVIHHHSSSNQIASTVHSSSHEGNLKERRQLILVLNAGPWVHQSSLIAQSAVAAHQNLPSNCLPEHLHLQGVSDDLLGFLQQQEKKR